MESGAVVVALAVLALVALSLTVALLAQLRRTAAVARYVQPGEGTIDYAFLYVPAENVFYECLARPDDDLGGQAGAGGADARGGSDVRGDVEPRSAAELHGDADP